MADKPKYLIGKVYGMCLEYGKGYNEEKELCENCMVKEECKKVSPVEDKEVIEDSEDIGEA